jgi:hypothetical protein
MTTLFTHTLSMGIARGVHLTRAYAYLPPMWLLSLAGIALGLVFVLLSRPPRQPDRA